MEVPEWVTWIIGLGFPTFGLSSVVLLWSMRMQIAVLNVKVDRVYHDLSLIEKLRDRIERLETQVAVLLDKSGHP